MTQKNSEPFGRKVDRRDFLGTVGSLGLIAGADALPGGATTQDYGEPVRKLLANSEPMTWVITGDSITQGALHTFGWKSYPELFAERVRWELRRVRDIVINTGISGDTSGGILKETEWRIFRFHPHVTSLMFGTNDCVAGATGRDAFR